MNDHPEPAASRTARDLRQSDASRKFALESAGLGEWELDLTTMKVRRSPLHDRIFGYPSLQPEWSFDIFLCHVHPDDRERVSEDFRGSISQGKRTEFECRIVRPGGDIRWIWVCGNLYREESGWPAVMFGIVQDVTERREAMEALRASEERFRLFIDHAPAALAMFDREMRYLHVSRRWRTDYGLGDSDLRGISHYDVFPEIPERWKEAHRRGMAGEILAAEHDRFERDDRKVQWVRWEIRPWYDRAGAIGGILIFTEDITEREQAQVALRESEDRFQAMANGIPQLAWIADADGFIFWYNHRWYEYTGTTLEQMLGWAWQSVHDPEVLPFVLEKWKAAIADGHPFDMEFPLRGADGVFRTFLTRVMPLKDSDGRVVRWFGTNTDISERKRSEERLAAKTEELVRSQQALENQTLMLQSVLDSIEEGLVAADETGRFILWNPAAERIVGLGAAPLPPEEWNSHYGVYKPDTVTLLPLDENPLVRAIRGEPNSTEMYFRNHTLSTGLWIESNSAPLRDKNGALRGGVIAFRDISQRKANELEIRRLNEDLEEKIARRTEQLESANRELEAFTYSVSHDLRSPLRHIGAFSRILGEDHAASMPPDALELLRNIQAGTHRMTLLVDGLLSLSKLGRQSLNIGSVDMNVAVADVISVLKPEWENRSVEWRIAPLPTVECDPVLIAQVLQNLIGNALKYSRRRSAAVIEIGILHRTKESTAIFVKDNGAGFNMKYADRLFGVFQRLHAVEEFEGTGVGLAIAGRIIQKHGGKIWAEAEPDRGATFFFTVGENQRPGMQQVSAEINA